MGLLSEKTTNRFLAIRDAVHFIATLGLIVGVVGVPYIELKLGYYNAALEKLKNLGQGASPSLLNGHSRPNLVKQFGEQAIELKKNIPNVDRVKRLRVPAWIILLSSAYLLIADAIMAFMIRGCLAAKDAGRKS